jgi:hypothetical protein
MIGGEVLNEDFGGLVLLKDIKKTIKRLVTERLNQCWVAWPLLRQATIR